jgi:hypothetical protein
MRRAMFIRTRIARPTAAVPLGFWGGLNHMPPLGGVLVHG